MLQSSNTSSQKILATWPEQRLLCALCELANIRDDAGASRFLTRFPDFAGINDSDWLLHRLKQASTDSPEPLIDSFLKGAAERLLPTPQSYIKYLSAILQKIWRGTPEGMQLLTIFVAVESTREAIRVAVALYQQDDSVIGEAFSEISAWDIVHSFQADWTRAGRFRCAATTPIQLALQILWEKSSVAKICKNPDCPAPFFIARRVQQQYCGDECATPFRLEAKMKYWNSIGKKRREARKHRGPKKRGGR